MNSVIGTLTDITGSDNERVGTVNVRGAHVKVPLRLVPTAQEGDVILVEAGVAVAILSSKKQPISWYRSS